MTRPLSLQLQIENAVAGLTGSARFDDEPWLTFYIAGPPDRLADLAALLERSGWTNVTGSEIAFIYPKTRARLDAAGIVATAQAVAALCSERGCELLNVDADTGPHIGSTFVTLFQA